MEQEYLSLIKNISNFLYPYKEIPKSSVQKNMKKSSLRELQKKRSDQNEEPYLAKKLLEWLKGLDYNAKTQVLTHKNQFLASILQEMHLFNIRTGQKVFKISTAKSKNQQDYSISSIFTYRDYPMKNYTNDCKSSHPLGNSDKFVCDYKQIPTSNIHINNIEIELITALRFCDKDAYCDCLSLDPSMPIEEFLYIMRRLTANRAFSIPCRVSWDSLSNSWTWDYPTWYNQEDYYSMGTIACASFERAIWMQFWNFHDIDPRTFHEAMVYKNEKEVFEYSIKEIVQFLETLDDNQRKNIVGDFNKHTEICRMAKTQIKPVKNSNQKSTIYIDTNYAKFTDDAFCYKNIETISLIMSSGNMLKFVESLYFTPNDKIGTLTNVVYRKTLIGILTALAEKEADNLIKDEKLCEKIEKPVQVIKKKHRKKYKKKEKKIPLTEEQCREIAFDLLNKVISELEEKAELQKEKTELQKEKAELQKEKPNPKPQKNESFALIKPICNSQKIITEKPIDEIKNPTYNNHNHNGYTNGQKKQYYRKDNYKKQTKRPHSSKTTKKTPNSDHSIPKSQTAKTSQQVTPTKPEGTKSKFQWWSVPEAKISSNLDNNDFPPLSSHQEPETSNILYCPNSQPTPQNSQKSLCNTISVPVPTLFSLLHHEILRFTSIMKKKVQEKFKKFLPTFNEIISHIKTIHSDATLTVFGSYGTSLALDTSDIDLVIKLTILPNRIKIQEYCQHLQETLKTICKVTNIQAITTARIPIVKIKTEDYNLDITYEDENQSHQGTATINLTKNFICLCPMLKEITLVCKKLLYVNELNSSYHGGLNSYSLFLWIVAFFNSLKCHEPDLGKILMMFLDFYGNHFDPTTTGISVVNGGSMYTLPFLCFENAVTIDPLSGFNITGNLYKVKEILALFSKTHEQGFSKVFWKT
ncbi:hypothetical protein SteCoe_25837 [Stentor coeruleus]|uniref:Polymerase nucleotidyl transferase domain-containing protein n=1 Tax=Stentor coeruleus TaxID=5963 RepID=A0A1R2BEG8_9CILI|nr:hypothetical protein SteCoe_25837 [Stentor coeruleus]